MNKTDKELLELAAKAINLNAKPLTPFNGFYITGKGIWNPLESDGDALRLAVDLDIGAFFHDDGVKAFFKLSNCVTDFIAEPYNNDKHAATRRAIVRAAAAIGESMQ